MNETIISGLNWEELHTFLSILNRAGIPMESRKKRLSKADDTWMVVIDLELLTDELAETARLAAQTYIKELIALEEATVENYVALEMDQ